MFMRESNTRRALLFLAATMLAATPVAASAEAAKPAAPQSQSASSTSGQRIGPVQRVGALKSDDENLAGASTGLAVGLLLAGVVIGVLGEMAIDNGPTSP